MWKMLKAGYMEQWTYHHTYSGTPQGSGVSPILANIYLNELDEFLKEYQLQFKVGTSKRKPNKEYGRVQGRYAKQKELLRQTRTKESVGNFKAAQQELLHTPYYPNIDPGYKTLQFNRYADDFVVGIIGSRKDAERVKTDIRDFLANTLKLTLSEEKTKITHSGELINYLGYQFTVRRCQDVKRDSSGVLRRMWYGKVALYVPHDKYEQDGVISIPYVTKSGPKRCEFYHDGFTKKKELPPLTADTLPQYMKYAKRNNLANRLKASICELCGAKTREIHMHHIKRLKDLTGKDELELKMMQMRRKSIALCPECYAKAQQRM